MARTRTLVGLGAGVAAAGAAAATGIARDQIIRRRRALSTLAAEDAYEVTPDQILNVLADDGVKLHVEIDEPDPDAARPAHPTTVVFSHGYCLSQRSWVLQRKALTAAGYRVVLWDQRSHGQSGRSSEVACNIDQLGLDLYRVIEETAPEGPIALIGHSMGGMTMMALAESHSDLVRDRVVAAAFVATSAGGAQLVSLGFGETFGRILTRVGPGVLDSLGKRQGLVDAVLRRGRDIEEFFVQRYSFGSPVPPAAVRFTGDLLFHTPLSVMGDFLPTFEHHDKRAGLATFNGIETLVLNGSKDVLTPPEHSAEIVRLVPGAEHVVIADAGHIIMLEHPDVVDEQLIGLIERGGRAHAEGVKVGRKPRIRLLVTDIGKRRRIARARSAQSRRGRRA